MVTVASFVYVHQAYVLKSRLEAEGIDCQITNEHMLQVYHFLSNAMGGAQLQVAAKDYERAVDIMRDAGLEPDTGEINPLLKRLVLLTQALPFGKTWSPIAKAFVVVGFLLMLIVSFFVSFVYATGPSSLGAAPETFNINQEQFAAMHLYRAGPDDATVEHYSFENPKRALAQIEQYRSSIELKILPWERAIALYHLGSYPLALIEFNRYLSRGTPTDPSVHYNMGLCYRNRNMLDSAFAFFQLAYEHLNTTITNTRDESSPAITMSTGDMTYYRSQLYCLIHLAELMELKERPLEAIKYYTIAHNQALDCNSLGFDCQNLKALISRRLQSRQNQLI